MMTNRKKDEAYYKSLPYTVILRLDEDGDYVARIDELPGCIAHGKTQEEALENLDEVKELWIADSLERNDPIPEPVREETLPSGKWVQRVPRSLHKKLVDLAKREKVSLNQLVTTFLAEAVGIRHHETQIAAETSEVAHNRVFLSWHRDDLGLPQQRVVTSAVVYSNPPWLIERKATTGRIQASHVKVFTRQLPDQIRTKLGSDFKEYAQGKTTQHKHE
jgi:antitoxin HicB